MSWICGLSALPLQACFGHSLRGHNVWQTDGRMSLLTRSPTGSHHSRRVLRKVNMPTRSLGALPYDYKYNTRSQFTTSTSQESEAVDVSKRISNIDGLASIDPATHKYQLGDVS